MLNSKIKLLKKIARDIWDRFEFSSKLNTKYSEITITEDLIFKLYQSQILRNDNSILIFESTDEKSNGSDLEIFVEVEVEKYLYLVVQAKRIYIKSNKYEQISHKVQNDYQIDLLENYAKKNNAIALYLLYNYFPSFKKINKRSYGCTLVCSQFIKKNFQKTSRWKIPHFNDMHKTTNQTRHAIPLFLLALPKCFKSFILQECKIKYKLFNVNEFIYDKFWKSIDSNEELTLDKNVEEQILNNIPEFTPRYRVVIHNEHLRK